MGPTLLWKNLKNRQYGAGLIGVGTISLPQFHPLVNLITVAVDGTVRPTKYLEILENAMCMDRPL